MKILRMEFGKRLLRARKSAGLMQWEIADAAGVDPSAVSNWEHGKDFPQDARLPDICKALGVDESYFTQPTEVIKSDPLPQWAETISTKIEALEQKRGPPIPSEISENWHALNTERQLAILWLATGRSEYKERLHSEIGSRLEGLVPYLNKDRPAKRGARLK